MNRVAVVARYVNDQSFILLYFHSFVNINLFLKIKLVISTKKVAHGKRERSLTVIPFCNSQGVSVS